MLAGAGARRLDGRVHDREIADMDRIIGPATREAALSTLARIEPEAYIRTRNHLDGAVTLLSPYLTHGVIGIREVLAHLQHVHRLPSMHKLIFELGWREYFRHCWRHDGNAIFSSSHSGPLPDDAYARELPPDVREGRTGLPVVDLAVRTLYGTGYLHNHARLWLASYAIHLRKIHWRAGADWMWSHLLDGDLASNHLSWQWVIDRMMTLADVRWIGEPAVLRQALIASRSLSGVNDPHLGSLGFELHLDAPGSIWPEPGQRQRSFSAWWKRVQTGLTYAAVQPPSTTSSEPVQ
jgi:hypothetical protein